MAFVEWTMHGPEIANCNCNYGCPCQFNALPTHGDCRAMTAVRIDKGHFGDVDHAPIEFDIDIDKRKGRVRIAGVIDTNVGPIRNPVTGAEHRARVVLPNGFEYREAEYASGRTQAGGAIKLALGNTHSHLATLNLSTHGAG
jgi:hypothetical protein